MKKNKSAKTLSTLFKEFESQKLSDAEMDKELRIIEVDPVALVSEGLELVKRLTEGARVKEHFDYMPLAAGRPSSDNDDVNKSLKTKRKRKPKA